MLGGFFFPYKRIVNINAVLKCEADQKGAEKLSVTSGDLLGLEKWTLGIQGSQRGESWGHQRLYPRSKGRPEMDQPSPRPK